MKYNYLGVTDLKVSYLSLGGGGFSQIYGGHDEEKSIALVREALSNGVNYMETGPWYGQGTSERLIGKALIGVPRESYFIGSKVGRYELDIAKMFDFSAEMTEAGVDNTLQLLGLDYVDLIQVHDSSFGDRSVILKETLPTLERAVRDGKVRYIGLADYDIELMQELVEESDVKISSVLSYSKATLLDNRLQNYTSYFKSKGVGIINAAATGMGLLSNRGPQPWHPSDAATKEICRQAAEYCKSNNIELARLATWYSLSQPGIDTHVCGLYTLDQLRDTIQVLDTGLTDHEAKVLEDIKLRFFNNTPLHWDDVEVESYRRKMNKHTSKLEFLNRLTKNV